MVKRILKSIEDLVSDLDNIDYETNILENSTNNDKNKEKSIDIE